MEDQSRRSFLRRLLAGAGISLLGLLPGTFFSRGKVFAAAATKPTAVPKPTLDTALPKITKSNIVTELPKLALPHEDKVAIAAVTEVPPDQLKASVAKIKGGDVSLGGVCGNGCPGGGSLCGFTCTPGKGAIGVIDQKGQFGINVKSVNKMGFLQSIDKAMALPR